MVQETRPLLALAWMTGAVASFTAMAVAGRELAGDLDTFEIMFYRSVAGFLFIAAVVYRDTKGFAQISPDRPMLHVWRNIVHFAAQNLWFYGVAVIALSELVALEFTNPIWVAVLAPFLLGERLTTPRILAAVLGFLGVLVIAQPGYSTFELGHAAGLGAALGFALNTMLTRQIMNHDTVLCVLFWMTASQAVMGLILALPGGIPAITMAMLPWISIIAVCGLTAHYALTSALEAAPATIVAPMEFARLPVVAIIGMVFYDEPLVLAVALGATLIVVANLLNLASERRRSAV